MISTNVSFLISGILFALGLMIFWTRRSIRSSLLAVWLVWISALLNLVVTSHDGVGGVSGQAAAVLLAVLVGLETCIIIAMKWCRKTSVSQVPQVHDDV